MDRDLKKFCNILKNLEPIELIGMARLLGVTAYKEKEVEEEVNAEGGDTQIDFHDREKTIAFLEQHFEPKTGEEIIYETCEKFYRLDRTGKRNILKSMKSLSSKG